VAYSASLMSALPKRDSLPMFCDSNDRSVTQKKR
jgi:hypothetical protein